MRLLVPGEVINEFRPLLVECTYPTGMRPEYLIDFPDPVTGESFKVSDSEYRKQKTYEDSYDEETQTLIVEFSMLSKENVDWSKPVNPAILKILVYA